MRVLKVVAEGAVTSFRYPHFVQGVHLTYEMPPPATVHGHICSAIGSWMAPDSCRFAYHFTSKARFVDYEHIHIVGGKEPTMNPFKRHLLFEPRLTLYIDRLDLMPAFLSPHFLVVLGRSQDLMTYTAVGEVELERAPKAFFAGTLVSLAQAAAIGGRSTAVTMARYISPERHVDWASYGVIKDAVVFPDGQKALEIADSSLDELWVDPEEDARHPWEALQRAVVWHRWDAS